MHSSTVPAAMTAAVPIAQTPPRERQDSTEPVECPDSAEPALSQEPADTKDTADPTDPTDRKLPTEAMDRELPTEPMERNESTEPIDSAEFFDHSERQEPSTPALRLAARAGVLVPDLVLEPVMLRS
ncbi:hypothetical protein [Streptomyces sp. NPDC005476]|uniref:hypothetical protein n=1 Tax=Streptomyces sp. NPDC005476 TaxID=3156882 RepID=UPI003453B4CC